MRQVRIQAKDEEQITAHSMSVVLKKHSSNSSKGQTVFIEQNKRDEKMRTDKHQLRE